MPYDVDDPSPPQFEASVVVPNLNYARFLKANLDSLAAQNYPDLDVIIVDGGSTDGSLEIIEPWAREHGARWISEPDDGQAQAINKGFRMARGEILTWLNSDDVLASDAVARAAKAFNQDQSLSFLWGYCLFINEEGQALRIGNPDVREDLSELRRSRCFVTQPGSWFRRSVLEQFGFLDECYHYAFDYEFFLRLAGKVNARFLPEVVSEFRLHSSSKSVKHRYAFLPEQWRAFRAQGGKLASPFVLDMIRNQFVMPAISQLTRPFRALLWRALGLKPGTRVRA
jgi:glycosyltransferase involved in cell wall biosynthesis